MATWADIWRRGGVSARGNLFFVAVRTEGRHGEQKIWRLFAHSITHAHARRSSPSSRTSMLVPHAGAPCIPGRKGITYLRRRMCLRRRLRRLTPISGAPNNACYHRRKPRTTLARGGTSLRAGGLGGARARRRHPARAERGEAILTSRDVTISLLLCLPTCRTRGAPWRFIFFISAVRHHRYREAARSLSTGVSAMSQRSSV